MMRVSQPINEKLIQRASLDSKQESYKWAFRCSKDDCNRWGKVISLSAAIHSIMANEIDYCEDAYEYFRSAAYMDINNFKRNTTGGLHMACLGGVWMSVVNGFMGMRLYNDGLHFAPKLPEAWESCTFNINYNNAVIRVCAKKDHTRFTLIDGENVHFTIYGEDVELSKGDNEIIIR